MTSTPDPAAATAPRRRTPPKVPRPTRAPRVVGPVIERLEAELAVTTGDDRRSAVERFWSAPASVSPVVEVVAPGEAVVTFVWRDDAAREVLLFANRLTDERNLADSLMDRVPGTDVWHLSYRMPTTWRASYAVLAHAGDGVAPWAAPDQAALRRALDVVGRPDPRNPATCRNRAGTTQSVVELPDAPPQPWLARRAGVPRGSLTERAAPGGRRVWVYEPAGVDGETDLLLALDGDVWTGPQDLATTLDNLHHDGAVRPLRAVLVDAGSREQRWADLDGASPVDSYLAHDLLDRVRADYAIAPARDAVTVAGQSLGALTALRTLVAHPDRVGAAISQSASLWQADPSLDLAPGALVGTRAWVEVGRHEWVLQPLQAPTVARLRDAGADARATEFDGGHDYACWRGSLADALRHLHPPRG